MTILFKKIDRKKYEKLDVEELFNHGESTTIYAFLDIEKQSFKFSWQSDIVEPCLLELPEKLLFISIDLHVSIINIFDGSTLLLQELDSFFLCANTIENRLFICSELSITVFSLIENRVVKTFYLTDIYSSHSVNNGVMTVTLISGKQVQFVLQ